MSYRIVQITTPEPGWRALFLPTNADAGTTHETTLPIAAWALVECGDNVDHRDTFVVGLTDIPRGSCDASLFPLGLVRDYVDEYAFEGFVRYLGPGEELDADTLTELRKHALERDAAELDAARSAPVDDEPVF